MQIQCLRIHMKISRIQDHIIQDHRIHNIRLQDNMGRQHTMELSNSMEC